MAADLPELSGQPREIVVTAVDLVRLHTYLRLELWVNKLSLDQAARLAESIEELVRHSLRRGAHTATVRIWNQPHALIYEVCDLVQVRSSSTGTVIRAHTWK